MQRVLAWAGDLPGGAPESKLRCFRLIVLMHVAVRTVPAEADAIEIALSIGLFACLACAVREIRVRAATGIASLLLAAKLALLFPQTPNHGLLELIALGFLATTDFDRADDRARCGQALRWLTVIVLFWTGLQKVLYGTYVKGQFLACMVATDERFAAMFRPLLSEGDARRLTGPLAAGSGDYRFESPLLLVLSNAIYLVELVAPVLLLVPRTRTIAAAVSIAFIAAVQLGAREVYFGLVFVNLLLLFPAGDWNRRVLPVFVLVYAYLLAVRLHVLPEWFFN